MAEPPETRYARLGTDRIAYQVVGTGPPDLLWLGPWISHIDGRWEEPCFRDLLRRVARFSRLIGFDKRGSGASDRFPADAAGTWEDWVQDVRAVMRAGGSNRAVVCGIADGGPVAALFAATCPELVSQLILVNAAARFTQAEDYPWGGSTDVAEELIRSTREAWGKVAQLELMMPSKVSDVGFRRWWERYQRMTASPATAEAQLRIMLASDCRHALAAIHVPTLVIHRTEMATIPLEHGRYLAEHIEGAKLVELPGADVPIFAGDTDAIIDAIEEFVTGHPAVRVPDRAFATVLMTDIVESTDLAVRLGDTEWRALIDRHDDIARKVVELHGGEVVRTTGDGVLATFEGPERTLECSITLREALAELGVSIRAGIHAGEVELRDPDIGGLTVHITARVNALAEPNEILVTEAVQGLVVGSHFALEDRGRHALKGLPGQWRVYSAAQPTG
jgi:class 3 adenylate cyclase/alpha-beta hydrolase superfamily lysophospholipase